MKQRIITALLLAPLVLLGVLFLPTAGLMAVAAAALLVGMWEWTRMAGVQGRIKRAAILFLHAGVMAYLAWRGWPALFPWIVLLGVAFWFGASLWLRFPSFAKEGHGATTLKVLVGSLLVVPTWCAIGLLHSDPRNGPTWMLFALFIVWAADTFAFFAGRRFGGPKLAPSISPAKTWSGFFGGLFGVVVLSLAAAPVLGVSLGRLPLLLLASVIAGLAAVVGDLFESLVKRQAGVKDSGALIPGHGGMFDRIDSIVAAVPVFAFLKAWLEL
jgi:phosphatidate cytidylyltransferase